MNAAQIGPPGTGKTESLATLEGFADATKKKVGIIDVDGKASGSIAIQSLVKRGLFEILDPGARLLEGSYLERVKRGNTTPSQEPKGYLGFATIVNDLEGPKGQDYCAVAIDTLTILEDHIKRFISFTNRKAKFEFEEWNNLLQAYKEMFTFFYSLPIPLKIINMHSDYNRDENTGRVDLIPRITGSFKNEAASFPSEFYLCETVQGADKSKPPAYHWRVTPNDRFVARSNVFKGSVSVPQDWTPVWKTLL